MLYETNYILFLKCCNYAKYSTDNCFDTRSEINFNLDMTIHVLTPKLAGQQPMQKLYKIDFFFKKNVVGSMTFAGRLTKSAGHTVHALFILDPPYFAHITSLCLSLII